MSFTEYRGRQPMDALVAAMFCALVLLGATPGRSGTEIGGAAMKFELTSTSFTTGANIPKRFTCDGHDDSPELHWSEAPTGAKSFALIADDPDAPVGTWVHWVLFNLPPETKALPEGLPKTATLSGNARQGKNDFGNIGYGGPCPPPGKPHRYFFKLYALDMVLALEAGATKADVEKAVKGHIVAQAELMGRYGR